MVKVLLLLIAGPNSDVLGRWRVSWIELEVVNGLGEDVGFHAFRSQAAEVGCSVVSNIIVRIFLLVS